MQIVDEAAYDSLLTRGDPQVPTLIQSAFEPFTERLWQIFLRACRAKRSGSRKAELRFYLEQLVGGAGESFYFEVFDPRPFLPRPEHRAFSEYAAYLGETFGGRRFGIIANNLHLFDIELWMASQPFMRRLVQARGVPRGGASLDMFFGNYRQTPFGIHKDSQDVYTWVLEGRKRFHLWPFPRFAGRAELELEEAGLEGKDAQLHVADQAEYQELLAESVVLEGAPGDMMFWPASWWHCADNPEGGLALTVGAGIAFEGNLVAAKTQGYWEPIVAFPDAPPTASRVRASLRRIARDERVAGFQRELAKAHLSARTGSYYFQVPPPLDAATPDDGQVVVRDPRAALEWVAVAPGEWVLASNGHVTTVAGPARILRELGELLSVLERGEPALVGELLERFTGARAHAREAAREVLRLLVSWRALIHVASA